MEEDNEEAGTSVEPAIRSPEAENLSLLEVAIEEFDGTSKRVPPKLSDSHFLILYSTRYGHGAEHF
jgi:hypothetical protein